MRAAAYDLRPVQMAEGDVGEPLEHARVHGVGAAHRQGSLRLRLDATDDVSMGDGEGPPDHDVAAGGGDGRLQDGLVGAAKAALEGSIGALHGNLRRGHREVVRRGLRIQVRQRDDVERAVREGEAQHVAAAPVAAAHVQAAGIEQLVRRRHAVHRVVVPGDDNHLRPVGAEAADRIVEQRDDLGRGDGPVVDVARHDYEFDAFSAAQLDEPVEERALVVDERHGAEVASQVPVAGVEDSHG